MSLIRLDSFLSQRESISRERASIMIKEGLVFVNSKLITKASFKVKGDEKIELSGEIKYVGRGYLKLEKALDEFAIDVKGKRVLDVGSSTGGFTQLLLERGARKVVAVDVGRDQMASSLRGDSRIVLKENTDIRELSAEEFDLVVVDLSFISLTKVSAHLSQFVGIGGKIVCLVKPQFELGSKVIGKRGIVKNNSQILESTEKVLSAFSSSGLFLQKAVLSPIRGGEGNVEVLILLDRFKSDVSLLGLERELKEKVW